MSGLSWQLVMSGRRLRVAVTLEQCWHAVPGGTASSALETVKALQKRDDVEVLGVAARHAPLPPQPWTPTVRMHQLPLPRIALYESWHALRWPPVQRATGPVDVIHATTFAIPPKNAPLVVTVHDLASCTSQAISPGARTPLLPARPGVGTSKCGRRAGPVAVNADRLRRRGVRTVTAAAGPTRRRGACGQCGGCRGLPSRLPTTRALRAVVRHARTSQERADAAGSVRHRAHGRSRSRSHTRRPDGLG